MKIYTYRYICKPRYRCKYTNTDANTYLYKDANTNTDAKRKPNDCLVCQAICYELGSQPYLMIQQVECDAAACDLNEWHIVSCTHQSFGFLFMPRF